MPENLKQFELNMEKIKAKDKKLYVLGEKRDYQILQKIYKLEKCKLSLNDKKIVQLIKTQLRREWREPLIKFLNKLEKNI